MNILEAEDIVKGLPDDALMQYSEYPTGQIPEFLVFSEIQRRTDMRNRYAQQMQEQPQGTVADQIKQQGIMSMMPQGGMGPQGMPPQMAMPPMGMPPQMMSGGGIVKLAEGGDTFLDTITPAGKTVREQLDAMISSRRMSYADMLAFASRKFPGRKAVVEYIQSKAGRGEGMPSAAQEVPDRPPYESREARMPNLAGGSDIYEAPVVLRAAKALGLFDSYKKQPEPMREPMASALASQFESQYATPDLSQRLTADMLTGADPVPSRVPENTARPIGLTADMLTEPERMREPMASALARQFESEYATPDLSDRLTSDRNLQNEGIWQQIGGGIADMFGAVGDSMSESARNSLFGRLTAASKESASRDPDRYTREEALPYTGTKAGTEQSNVATAVEAVAENTPRNDASGQDFSIMDQFFDDVSSGDITVQGRSPVQAQGVPSPVEPPPADAPDLSIADLIADQRRMTQANMLMQLGAGIYGGDLSKGLSAAGMAGMKGSQAEQALALKERLAKYQAGREDIARADKSKQFYDQLELLEKRYDNELRESANIGQRELFRTVTAMVEAATGEVILPADQKQALVESLMNKYLNLYAPSFGVTDIPTLNRDTQKGPRDFKSLARG